MYNHEQYDAAATAISRTTAHLLKLVAIRAPGVLIENARRRLLSRVESFPCDPHSKQLSDDYDSEMERDTNDERGAHPPAGDYDPL